MGAANQVQGYQDKGMDYLSQLYGQAGSLTNQSAGLQNQIRGQNTGLFGQLGNAAAMGAGTAIACLPKGTQIELEEGTKAVEELHVGDIVKGGKIITTSSHKRPHGHKFYQHNFEKGSVIMSMGHPSFEKELSLTAVESDSPATFDILTDSGYYFVNGVKLGSTIRS
jgi:hypothetical protein